MRSSVACIAGLFVLGACSSSTGSPKGGVGSSLPPTSFVFVRAVDTTKAHIVAYDTATQAETVLATLDDAGSATELAISPDRTHVVFIGVFRASADQTVKGDTKAMWSVSADGQSYTRLTPALPADTGAGIKSFAVDRLNPEFTRDGASVLFVLATSGIDGSQNKSGSSLMSVPAGGGAAQPYADANADCQDVAYPRFYSDASAMTAVLTTCAKTTSGIALYSVPPAAPVQRVAATDGAEGPAILAADGATFYYRTQIGAHNALVARGLSGGKPKTLYAPADVNVAGFDVSPDGTQIVVGEGGCRIVVLSGLDAATPTVTPITTDAGGSCSPSWH